jgi:hypothetical protein
MDLNKYNELFAAFGIAIVAFFMILFTSVIGGTMLWLIYPHIHALFPTAAQNGVIALDLGWWNSVCVVWIFGILLKPSNSSKTSK